MAGAGQRKLEIQLLGGFAVALNGTPVPAEQWKLRKVRALVKLLALAAGHRLPRDQVIEALWPESDLDSGANAFYQALYNARRVFEHALAGKENSTGFLLLKEGILALAPDWEVQVDVEQFEAASARLAGQEPGKYQAALNWYPGDLLPEDLYEEWAAVRREPLRQRCLELLRRLAALYETRRETAQAIQTYHRLLAMEPADEEAHAHLMRLYVGSGQRGMALRQYQALTEALRDLSVEPEPRTLRLYEEIQAGRLVEEATQPEWIPTLPAVPPPRRQHNLPNRLSTFIGREKEIDQVLEMLRETRLLTITGAGGVGKTSLAVQAAVYLSTAIREGSVYRDGIWLVELAALEDPQVVAQACAQALEIPFVEVQTVEKALCQFMENKQMLLILDNCEHLLDACAQVSETLLRRSAGLSILATSREPLHLAGEKIFPLLPLPVPGPDQTTSLDSLSRVESLRLFIERARLVSPGFTLSHKNAAALALICRQLDGIPLALELAAARTRLLPVEQIAGRLNHAFRILNGGSRSAPPRHQALKVSMDWSYQLLSPEEKAFFAQLAVFNGGWTLEAAEEVCVEQGSEDQGSADQGSGDVLNLLGQLVEKSLVTVNPSSIEVLSEDGASIIVEERELRYSMLETVRQYALERLLDQEKASGANASAPCQQLVRDRHLAYFARLTARAAAHWRGPEAVEWMDRLERELPNLYSSLEWSLESENGRAIELGLQMNADLLEYWNHRMNSQDSLVWSERFLTAEADRRGGVPLRAGEFPPNRLLQRARALRFLSHVNWFGHFQQTDLINHLAESEILLRQLGSAARLELGITLRQRWNQAGRKEDQLKQEFLEIFREENAQVHLADYHRNVALEYLEQGNFTQAIDYLVRSLAMYRQLGDYASVGEQSVVLARAYLYQGDYQRARLLVQEAISIARRLRTRSPEAYYWLILLEIARAEGSYAEGNGYAETALAISRRQNDTNRILTGLWILAENAWSMGDLERAKVCADEILGLCQENTFFRETGHYLYGRIALTEGRLEEAQAQLREALRWMNIGFWPVQKANHLMGYVVLFWKLGRLHQAAQIAGAIDALARSSYPEFSPYERFEYDEALAALRAALSKEAFAQAWTAGQEMTMDQAQALAME